MEYISDSFASSAIYQSLWKDGSVPIVAAGDDDTEMGMAELFFGGWLPIPEQLSFSERFRDGLVINNVSNECFALCNFSNLSYLGNYFIFISLPSRRL